MTVIFIYVRTKHDLRNTRMFNYNLFTNKKEQVHFQQEVIRFTFKRMKK